MAQETGAGAVARTLAGAGVRRVFSLSGNQVLSLYEALDRAGIGIVHTRHEGAAVHMADGWARLTGEVGVALVSAGPGHANALGALAMAGAGSRPCCCSADTPPWPAPDRGPSRRWTRWAWPGPSRAGRRWPGVRRRWPGWWAPRSGWRRGVSPGRRARCTSACRWTSWRVWRGAGAGAPRGGAQDSLQGDAGAGSGPPGAPDEEAIRRILGLLQQATRPLVLVGPSGARPAAQARLAALSARTGLPCLLVDHPRGLADPALGRAGEAVAGADAVLLLARSQDYRIGYAAPPVLAPGCRLLQIDPIAGAIGRHRPVEVGCVAPLLPALDALLARGRSAGLAPGHTVCSRALGAARGGAAGGAAGGGPACCRGGAPRPGRGCTPGGCWGSWRRCSHPETRNPSAWWWTGGSSASGPAPASARRPRGTW